MKNVFLTFCFFCTLPFAFSQTNTYQKRAQSILESDSTMQQFAFYMDYYMGYASIKGEPDTSGAKRTLKVVKKEIRDTMVAFNSRTVSEQSVNKLKDSCSRNVNAVVLNSEFFSKGEDLKKYKGNIEFPVSMMPYGEYVTIYVNITSVVNKKGVNLLVQGRDTILGNYNATHKGMKYKSGKFYFDNSTYDEALTISGTAQYRIPKKFTVISFASTELNVPKTIAGHTFKLLSTEGGKVVLVSPGEFGQKENFYIEATGKGNVRYRSGMSSSANISGYSIDLINKQKYIPQSEIKKYIPGFLDYLRKKPEGYALFTKEYKGSIDKVWIALPTEFITVTVPFKVEED